MSSKYYLQGAEYILPSGVKAEFVYKDKDYLHFVDRSTNSLYSFKESECFDARGFALLAESKVNKEEASKDVSEASSKHKHYFKDVSKLEEVDVYAILYLFEVTDPCIAHVVKKLLCTGKRGHKDFERDLQDSIDSLVRCMTLTKLFNQTKE